ncbi:MAG: hypothetical protein ACK4JY_03865 [Brevundimonas sp.]|uniref:hypothetical protein n=1 Tax=Brevundimonas sp. TaxID=1871086 RepID=UPI00391890FC
MGFKGPGEVDAYRRKWVEQVVSTMLAENRPRYSDIERLYDGATRDAAEQAVAAGVFPSEPTDRWKTPPFDDYLHKAVEPINNLYWAFDREGARHNGELWRHHPSLLQDVKGGRIPEFSRYEIEGIAGEYVKSGLKTATVDRLMVDLLVALEFAQYAQTTVNAPHVPFLAQNVLKRGVIFEWFFGRIIAAVIAYVILAAFWGLSRVGLFPDSWVSGVGLIVTCLWLLDAAWGTIMLPKVWMATRKAQQTIGALLNHMSLTYAALASDGPISAQHVTGLVNRATEAGVVWPGPLHVLLEDITARGGRF